MRSDLNKQLCERQRCGSSDKFGGYRNKQAYAADLTYSDDDRYEDHGDASSVSREPMKRRYDAGWTRKDLNENLNPLWGCVRKNVGRPWDKVYSELCSVFDKRSVINQHILIHLFQHVDTDTYLDVDGKVMVRSGYGNHSLHSAGEYYVHPRTRLLMKNKLYSTMRMRRKARRAETLKNQLEYYREYEDGTIHRKVDEVWYEIIREMVDASHEYAPRRVRSFSGADAGHHNHTYMAQEYIPAKVFKETKRTLSKKELKEYNLTNGPI